MITHGSAYAILIKLGGIRFAHAELSLTDKMQIKFLNGQVVYWKRGQRGVMPSSFHIACAALFCNVKVKRYMSWAVLRAKVSEYSTQKIIM